MLVSVLFCTDASQLSRSIRYYSGDRASHIALQFGQFVVGSYPSVGDATQIVPLDQYLEKHKLVYRHTYETTDKCLKTLLADLDKYGKLSKLDRLRFKLPEKLVKLEKLNFRTASNIRLYEPFVSDTLARKMSLTNLVTCGILIHKLFPEIKQNER